MAKRYSKLEVFIIAILVALTTHVVDWAVEFFTLQFAEWVMRWS